MNLMAIVAALLITLNGCSKIARTLGTTQGRDPIYWHIEEGKINEMLNQKNVIEARAYLKSLFDSGKEWCVTIYNNGKCQVYADQLPADLTTRLEYPIKCAETINSCQIKALKRSQAVQCQSDLKTYCTITSEWDVGHPSAATTLLDQIDSLLPKMSYDQKDESNKELREAKNKCLQNMKWGFYRSKEKYDHTFLTLVQKDSYFTGEYDTETKCHEARLALSKEYRHAIKHDRCVKRYVGKNIFVNIFELEFMYKNDNGAVINSSVAFKNLSNCEQAISRGFDYAHEDVQRRINPKSDESINKVIGICRQRKKAICQKDDKAINDLGNFQDI